MISSGAFLALPVAHFDMFDDTGSGRVYVYEVLFVLLMFCQGQKRQKSELAFALFDYNNRGHLAEVRPPCRCHCLIVVCSADPRASGMVAPLWHV